jgi:hypothetical protein
MIIEKTAENYDILKTYRSSLLLTFCLISLISKTEPAVVKTISPSLQSLTFNLVNECQSPLVVFLAIVSLILFCSSCILNQKEQTND